MSGQHLFVMTITPKELKERLLKRVAFHEARMKHYLKKEAQALKEKIKKQKEAMIAEQIQVEELDLALAQERSSYVGFSGISGYSGVRGYSGAAGPLGIVGGGHSAKFVEHERMARKLKFIATHLKSESYDLDEHDLVRLELV